MPAVLTTFWNRHKKFKKKSKNKNLECRKVLKKVFSEMSYHVWRFMGFKANDQWYGHIHGIVCSNDIILCTRVHIGMANKFSKWSYHFLCTKNIIFHFLGAKNLFFYEEPTKSLLQNCTAPFKKNIGPHFMYNWLNGFHSKAFDPPLFKLTKFYRFSRNRVKFELKVTHSLLMIFSKNHF